MSNSISRWVLIAIVFIAGLGVAGWYGPSQLFEARATEDWPVAEGHVESSQLLPPHKSGQSWRVSVAYSYEVDGAVYHSNRWDVNGERKLDSRGEAELSVDQHRVGSTVSVYYDPEQPGQAVLETGGSGHAWLLILFGVILLVFATRVAAKRFFKRR